MDLASCSLCIGKVLEVDGSTARIRFALLTDEEHSTSKFANRLWEDENNSFKEPLVGDFIWVLENKSSNTYWYTSYPCHKKDDELYTLWKNRNGILDVLLIRQNKSNNIKVYCDDDAFNIIFQNKDGEDVINHFNHEAWEVIFVDSSIVVNKDKITSSVTENSTNTIDKDNNTTKVGEAQIHLDKDKAIIYSDKDKAVRWSDLDDYLKKLEKLLSNVQSKALASPYTIPIGQSLQIDIPKLKLQHPKIESKKVYLE